MQVFDGAAGEPSRRYCGADRPFVAHLARSAFALVLCILASGLPEPTQAFEATSFRTVNSAVAITPHAVLANARSAGDVDEAVAALRDFAQRLGPAQVSSPKASADDGDDDARLRAYVRDLDARETGTPIAPGLRLADADNLLDAIRSWGRKDDAGQQGNSPPARTKVPAPVPKSSAPAPEATFVGTKTCLTCHATQAATFGDTLMGRIGRNQPGKFDCENCHGPGSAHAKAGGGRGVGGIISFRSDDLSRTPAENNAICLGCHEKSERTYWSGSTHEQRNVPCTACHTVMRKVSPKFNLKTAWEPDTCFQCHKDRRAQMYRSSHMPLRQGKIVCSDCHNPHGSFTEALLRENSINDTCYKCHAEKRGPFLFEHLPVRENCDNCHNPHGSVNEYMLKVSRPRLCGECHTVGHGLTSGINVVQTFSRSCQNCHTEVHGTNDPSGALLHR